MSYVPFEIAAHPPFAPRIRPVRGRKQFVALLAVAALPGGAAAAVAASVSPLVPVAAMAVLTVALVVAIRPAWGLPIALSLLWTNTAGVLSFYHGAPTAVAVVVPLLLTAPLVDGWLRGERIRVDGGFAWMMVVLLVEIAATLASAYPDVGLGRIEKFLQEGVVVYLLLINVVRTPDALRTAAWALIAAGGLLGVITLVQELSHGYVHTFLGFAQLDHAFLQAKEDAFRAQGPVDDANYYAQLLLPSFALAVVASLRERTRRARAWGGVSAVVILVAIVFTYSRGAAVALGALVALLMLVRYLQARHLVAIVCVGGVVLIAFPQYGNRLASLASVGGATAQVGSSNAADLSIQQRATENLAAWLALQDHPLLGVGPGGFPITYQHYANEVGGAIHGVSENRGTGGAGGQAPQRSVPNIFLSVAADQGIVGVSVFVCLLGSTILALWAARRRWARGSRELEALGTGYLLALITYIVAGFFLALAFERYLWALLALCGAATFVLMRRAEEWPFPGPSHAPPKPQPGRGAFVPDGLGADIPGRRDEISHPGMSASATLDGR